MTQKLGAVHAKKNMTQKLGAEHAKKNYDPFLPKVVRKKIYDPKTAAWLCDTERRGTFSGPAGQFGEDFSSMRG